MAFLKAGRNETRDLLFMRGWPDGFGERASEREREKERERKREREVNVSASRLILRLKIIRGPTPVTTREESWGAYLRGTFDVGHQPPIFYSPRKLHGSLHVPWEFHVDRLLLFFFFFFFFFSGRFILSPFMRETSGLGYAAVIWKRIFLGRSCGARMQRLSMIGISFNSLGVNGNFMQIYETDERGTFFRINVKIFLVKCKNMLARFNK